MIEDLLRNLLIISALLFAAVFFCSVFVRQGPEGEWPTWFHLIFFGAIGTFLLALFIGGVPWDNR